MRSQNYSGASGADSAARHDDTDALIREADHRIANSLSALAGLVRMQSAEIARRSAPLSAAEASLLLSEYGGRVDALGRLHRLLSQARSHEVDAGVHLREVAGAMAAAMPGVVLAPLAWEGGCHIREDQAQPLALIISEVITNSAKHAHPAGLPVVIQIACRQHESGRLAISVRDDGVGLPEDFDVKRGGNLGWRVIRALARQLDAELMVDSGPLGLSVTIMLPR
jgi:two-component sensor histidine kinase